MDKEKLTKILQKANSLDKGGNISLSKEFISLDDKITDVESSLVNLMSKLSDIDNKEVKTYESEVVSLLESIGEIKQSIDNKDMVVNVPLDSLVSSISKVESAVKNIKEVKIPDFPTDMYVTNLDNSDVVNAIHSIPSFPIKELQSMMSSLEDKLIEIKSETPEFDYKRVEKKLDEVTKAIKNISISVSGGGNSMVGVKNTSSTPVNPATSDNQEAVMSVNVHTNDTELRVFSHGHVCAENSTSTPLGISGVFAGDWQDTLDYSEVIISVSSDKDSATDGLVVYWSADGITSHETDEFSILANKGKTFSFPCNRRYVKLGYTNGGVAQTTFNLQTQLKRYASKGSSHRIKDSIVGDDDAILTKGIITGMRDDGVFGNATLDNANHLMVNSQPYLYAVAEGDIAGHSTLLKFGTRTAIAAATQSTIWEGTAALYTYLTSAEQLKISSSSANDTAAGSGVRTFTLIGLDANYNEITEVITLNGITAVTTTNSFLRIYRGFGTTVGTYGGTNAGNITITNNAGTIQLMYIPAGDGQTLMTLWTVPAGKTAYITQITGSSDTVKGARFSLYTRLNDGGTLYPWQIKYRAYLVGGNEVVPFNIPFKIPAKTDIEIRFTTPNAAGVTSGGATFELWYE